MMQNQRSRDRQWYRHRRAVVSVLILSVVSVIIVALFRNMYDSAEQNILNIWENNVIQLAKSTEHYLARPADAIEFSAAHVENLIAEGKTNQEIGEYLVREMDNYATLVENNYTGVYGYCRGDYLDASGWAPDADYDPTLRPWYVAAKENAGRVTLVSPFLNLQTGDMAGQMAADESRDMLMRFMDPATYEERLSGTHSVSYDFLSSGGRWLRVQLIVVDRDDRGKPKHIIWAIESIDRERRQQEHLRELAETDALSRLNNRRSGESRIRAMLASGTKGMFILLDIDSFKQINDHFGHVVGDLVITAVADALRRTFRDSDVVFRLGGDEFAVFAPGLENGDAKRRVLERLHREVSRIDIPELLGAAVTISVGATDYGAGDDSFEAMYQRADEKMYENKRRKQGANPSMR